MAFKKLASALSVFSTLLVGGCTYPLPIVSEQASTADADYFTLSAVNSDLLVLTAKVGATENAVMLNSAARAKAAIFGKSMGFTSFQIIDEVSAEFNGIEQNERGNSLNSQDQVDPGLRVRQFGNPWSEGKFYGNAGSNSKYAREVGKDYDPRVNPWTLPEYFWSPRRNNLSAPWYDYDRALDTNEQHISSLNRTPLVAENGHRYRLVVRFFRGDFSSRLSNVFDIDEILASQRVEQWRDKDGRLRVEARDR